MSVPYEAAPLYAPQVVEMAPPQKSWLETAGWPEPITHIQCKAHQNMVRIALYQINKSKSKSYSPEGRNTSICCLYVVNVTN